ncbi:MAG: hypothetical protein CL912_16550 [Deltaproteobacteria bacterium]|nr:hypothetical protein [Deltaproteobacteria bacterium]
MQVSQGLADLVVLSYHFLCVERLLPLPRCAVQISLGLAGLRAFQLLQHFDRDIIEITQPLVPKFARKTAIQ